MNEPFKLKTHHNDKGRFQIKVDGKWRWKKSRWDTCWPCERERKQQVKLEWWGVKTGDGTTNFWGLCPECGYKTVIEWVGKPRERHSGGANHGHLRRRRS